MTDEEAWALAERLNAKAPEGVRYEMRRTTQPLSTSKRKERPQLELGENAYEPTGPWYVARIADG